MGLFNIVLESVLNEVRAEDAYNRFYSSIPREDFDKITGGEENIDKFIQFFLNCVRDGKSSVDEAVEALNAYKNSDNLVKQKVKNKVSNGEYEDAAEVTYDVNYFSSGGAVLSRKRFAKDGYIKLGENERWICTCTTNYCANNHYYGASHWCTASDRMGRYDGYRYFKSYGVDADCVLIQFRWKGKIEPHNGDYSLPPQEYYDSEMGYTANTIPERLSMVQLQINQDLDIRQICDWCDDVMNERQVEELVGKQMWQNIDKEKVEFCLKKSKEQEEVEEKYQDSIYKFLLLRKEKRRKMLLAKRDALEDECEESNRQKKELVTEKWREFIQEKMYEDPEIIRYIIDRDFNNTIQVSDEAYAKTNYCKIWTQCRLTNNLWAFVIGPTKGAIKSVEDTRTSNGEVDYVIVEHLSRTMGVRETIVCFVHPKGPNGTEWELSNITAKGPFSAKAYVSPVYALQRGSENDNRFYTISWDSDIEVYDLQNSNSFKVDFFPHLFNYGANKFLFFDEDEDYNMDYVMYDERTGVATPRTDNDPKIYITRHTKFLIFKKDGWDYQVIGDNSGKDKALMYKVKSTNRIIEAQSIDMGRKPYFKLEFGDSTYNLLEKETSDFVFGINGERVWVETNGTCMMRFDERDLPNHRYSNSRSDDFYDHECFICRKPNGVYEKWMSNDGNREKCDKYGRTEKDLMADKNFKDWVAAGGHSPETKAQMDKMWADRKNDTKGDDGASAMAAWNDDDRGLDRRTPGVFAPSPFKMDMSNDNDTLWPYTDFKDKPRDNWRGYMDIIDPMFSKRDDNDSTKKRGLFYRIDKQGRPLDQPWYDEDEVPANLSDRPVRNGKIYENYKSLISLMNRMGLLED